MGKVMVSISITPDGFADAQNVIVDPEFFKFTLELMADADVVAFGRHTFEMFQGRWPQRLTDPDTPHWVREMAQSLHDIPKVVFSSTLKSTTWHNSTIVNQPFSDYINAFKRDDSGALLTFGSLSLIEALTEKGLVDDYYFNVMPLILGKGEGRLFRQFNLNAPIALKYVDCKRLASGAQIIHYQPAETHPKN
jgi:dihydrofolate reductase